MSIKQMSKVWEWSQAEGASLLLMLALADHADDDGYCFPGIQRLAKKCRVSGRSVQRHLAALEEKGEIIKDLNRGYSVQGGQTNRYRLTLKAPIPDQNQSGDKLSSGDKSGEGVTNPVGSGDRAMSPKPSVEPSIEPPAISPCGDLATIKVLKRENPKLPTSELAVRIAKINHRKLSTEWTKEEISAFKKLQKPFDADDLALVEEFYAANWPPNVDTNNLRHNLITFLNNYPGEVDKARVWKENPHVKAKKPNHNGSTDRNQGTLNAGQSHKYANHQSAPSSSFDVSGMFDDEVS